MKVLFKSLEFIFFRLSIFLIVGSFKLLNFIISNVLEIFYETLYKIDCIISRLAYKIYFNYISRFLNYLCSLSVYILPNLKNTCRSFLLNTILNVKKFFKQKKEENKKSYKKCLPKQNKNITNNYKSNLFNCIVKRACWFKRG